MKKLIFVPLQVEKMVTIEDDSDLIFYIHPKYIPVNLDRVKLILFEYGSYYTSEKDDKSVEFELFDQLFESDLNEYTFIIPTREENYPILQLICDDYVNTNHYHTRWVYLPKDNPRRVYNKTYLGKTVFGKVIIIKYSELIHEQCPLYSFLKKNKKLKLNRTNYN